MTGSMPPFPPDTDYHFLEFIGTDAQSQKHNQRFYLPFFAGCRTVADLGCGMGGLIELLVEQNIQAIGVDIDAAAVAAAQRLGAQGVQADALDYLARLEENSLDGIFAGHLVEHLPCETVYELIRQAQRVLRPQGRLVLATPNVRGLYAHLELFYMHFDHKRFYHPNLLCFFMKQAGFREWEWGENPALDRLLLPDVWSRLTQSIPPLPVQQLNFDEVIQALEKVGSTPSAPGTLADTPVTPTPPAASPAGWRQRLTQRLRAALVNWLVRPELDAANRQINGRLYTLKAYADWLRVYADWLKMSTDSTHSLAGNAYSLAADTRDLLHHALDRLDRSFECYAAATK